MKISAFNNTIEDWKNTKKLVEKYIKEKLTDNIELEVIVSVEEDSKESDVLLLQHYFPIADVARDSKIKTSLNVIINGISTDPATNKKWVQINQYLYVQNLTREGINITINREQIMKQTRYGRIIPVMSVNNQVQGNFYYKDIVKVFSDIKAIQLLTDFSKIVITAKDSQIIKKSQEHRDLIEQCEYIYDELKQMSEEEMLNDKNYFSKIFFLSKKDNIYNIYIKLFLSKHIKRTL